MAVDNDESIGTMGWRSGRGSSATPECSPAARKVSARPKKCCPRSTCLEPAGTSRCLDGSDERRRFARKTSSDSLARVTAPTSTGGHFGRGQCYGGRASLRHRTSRKNARTSLTNSSGCSKAAKCRPGWARSSSGCRGSASRPTGGRGAGASLGKIELAAMASQFSRRLRYY